MLDGTKKNYKKLENSLENLREWEFVVEVIKRHWIVYFIIWGYLTMIFSVSGLLLKVFWNQPVVYVVLIMFWMLFVVFIYVHWLNHELDLFIITNMRVIGVEQISFLNRTISECWLWQVQEVNSQTKWLIANILNYWYIRIQTAWDASNFEMNLAPDALQTWRKILNLVYEYKDQKRVKVQAPQNELQEEINKDVQNEILDESLPGDTSLEE